MTDTLKHCACGEIIPIEWECCHHCQSTRDITRALKLLVQAVTLIEDTEEPTENMLVFLNDVEAYVEGLEHRYESC